MPFLTRNIDVGFTRLQEFLLAMEAGDTVRLADLAQVSGLSEDTCKTALDALARVGILSCETDGRFVRQTLRRSLG